MKREVEPTLSLYNNVVFPALSCKVEVSLTLLRHGALLRLVPRIERGGSSSDSSNVPARGSESLSLSLTIKGLTATTCSDPSCVPFFNSSSIRFSPFGWVVRVSVMCPRDQMRVCLAWSGYRRNYGLFRGRRPRW